MIRRRTSGNAVPIRDFEITSHRGIDVTRPPTDAGSISRCTNMTVNLDGSVSLRKPIVCNSKLSSKLTVNEMVITKVYKAFYLYDELHYMALVDCYPKGKPSNLVTALYLYDGNGAQKDFTFRYTTYKDDEMKIKVTRLSSTIFPNLSSYEAINTSNSTVIANLKVNMTAIKNNDDDWEEVVPPDLYEVVSPNLYDTTNDRIVLDRYLKIHLDNILGWCVDMISPEPNYLTTSEDEFALNPNTTLDTLYSIRDNYNATLPSIRGIVPYAYGNFEDGKVTYAGESGATSYVAIHNLEIPFEYTTTVIDTPSGKLSELISVNAPVYSNGTITVKVLESHTLKHDVGTIVTADGLGNSTIRNVLNANLKLHATLTDGALTAKYRIRTTLKDFKVTYTYKVANSSLLTLVSDTYDCSYDSKQYTAYANDDFNTSLGTVSSNSTYGYGLELSDVEVKNFKLEGTLITVIDELQKYTISNLESVARVTENNKASRYYPLVSLHRDKTPSLLLKAFCNIPRKPSESDSIGYLATWYISSDGVSWAPLEDYHATYDAHTVTVRENIPDYSPKSEDEDTERKYRSVLYHRFGGRNELDDIKFDLHTGSDEKPDRTTNVSTSRPDVVYLNTFPKGAMCKFKIVTVEKLTSDDEEWDSTENAPKEKAQYRITSTIGESIYSPSYASDFEWLYDPEHISTVQGKKLLNGKKIYSYGTDYFKNNIYATDTDSFITPLFNVIDGSAPTNVNVLLPWREFLISASDLSINLHTLQDTGALTKIVNSSVGISKDDAACCKAILNGIIFKSGSKVYQLYPNMYSGDDSTLNLTDLSKPIAPYLEAYVSSGTQFAFSTESEYVLMLPLPFENYTECLRYNYTSKVWTHCTYPVPFESYKLFDIDDIRLYGTYDGVFCEYLFDKDYSVNVLTEPYGDKLLGAEGEKVLPIEFEWDTGQKTPELVLKKRFVETKFVFMTEDSAAHIPIELTVTVDGDAQSVRVDSSSDDAFQKTDSYTDRGVAGTAFSVTSATNADGRVLKQYVVRYSIKGRSVRHVLRGTSNSKFKMYATYVRYKITNSKR